MLAQPTRAGLVRPVARTGTAAFSRAFHSSRRACGAVVPFKLADIGEGITEVEVLEWFVKEGDRIEEFDRICEVQSDKANVEITSRFAGIVKSIKYATGEMAIVGEALLDIETDGEAEAEAAPAPEAPAPAAAAARPQTPQEASGERALASPATRYLAKQNGVDLALVPGTGKAGRVMKHDLLAYMSGGAQAAAATAPAPAPAAAPAAEAAPATPQSVGPRASEVVPIRGIQRAMVAAMNASLTVPHFGYDDEFRMDAATALRDQLKPLAEAKGARMSYMPLLIKAASLALLEYPTLNASVSADEKELHVHPWHNFGIAMDTPRGLLVPVVADVQDKSVVEIAAELNRLQALGAEGKLGEADLKGSTFSLSNIGAIGGTYARPVIAPPQVAIGAIGKIQRLPRFAEDGETVEAHRIMQISWSADHRVIDGATMARFSNLMRDYLQDPIAMLAAMR